MPEDKGEMREWNVRQVLPWTEIFRAFQLALDPYKLLLAAMAIVVLTLGWWLLSLVFGVPNQFGEWPPNAPRGVNPYVVVTERQGDLVSTEFWLGKSPASGPSTGVRTPATVPEKPPEVPDKTGSPAAKSGATEKTEPGSEKQATTPHVAQPSIVGEIYNQPPVHLEPFDKFIRPVTRLFKTNPGYAEWWYLFFGLLLTLATWAIFGGAITRIAAVQIARREKIGIVEALRFSVQKFLSFFSAPLIPFGGVAIVAILMIIGGFVFLIPYVGDFLAGLLWPLPLIGGLVMALILIGLVGWPLMYATISTEGSDSFDALSRCYAYVFQRPWHYLFYTLLALIYGVLVIFFIVFVSSFFVYLAKWGVSLTPGISWRATGDPVDSLFYYSPSSYDWQKMLLRDHKLAHAELDPLVADVQDPRARAQLYDQLFDERRGLIRERIWAEMNAGQAIAAALVGVWLHLIFLLMLGFAYSYFWSASTVIYFLLRKRVDDTDMDEVYLEEEEAGGYPPPAASTTPAPAAAPPGTTPLQMVEPQKGTGAPSEASTGTGSEPAREAPPTASTGPQGGTGQAPATQAAPHPAPKPNSAGGTSRETEGEAKP